ncbi:hypothetical protein FBG13_11345 [Cobetia marina]|jgi:Flp pilus assembly protein TadB|uniref:hypothetical protein n=1 Tax=Cobetia TaxID=204286 RepID=UPI0009853ECE|nr:MULTISPECIES: hypothetical protein [Cobetia]MDA5562960.1 hypothetical protein [Cobetia sp. MMG027]MDI6003181.1 hypothetical protein [Cobetia pacifica]POR04903.1 hypothetical protein BOH68_14575 [Cobetia sp. MM1IDA2H-1]TKD62117.1 hypothetical protein FBG13_11345 [Cobetia marina]GED42749.1 hypothetical protein HHA02_20780 [Cobetia marina]
MQGQQHNTLWNQARQWQANAGNQRPSQGLSGLKLVAAWLIGGVVMIFSLFAALIMMVLGIIMLPFIRRRMKKRMSEMQQRMQEAQDKANGRQNYSRDATREDGSSTATLDGEYQVKE